MHMKNTGSVLPSGGRFHSPSPCSPCTSSPLYPPLLGETPGADPQGMTGATTIMLQRGGENSLSPSVVPEAEGRNNY